MVPQCCMLLCPCVYVLQQYGLLATNVHFTNCFILFGNLTYKVGKNR